MKTVIAVYDERDDFSVLSFGIEKNSAEAHWGRGSRNVTIVHYVLSGYGYYNGKKVCAGEGFFIPSGVMHEYHSSKSCPWTYFWVSLNGKGADSVCKKYLPLKGNGQTFDYSFSKRLSDFSEHFFDGRMLGNAEAKGVFFLLMSYHEKKPEIAGNRYVIEAKKYIENNIHRHVTIREIADSMHISDRYLYNLFIDNEKISPKKHINTVRLEKACEMLRENNGSISEVAASVGFRDVLTFSRFFSKNKGVSPSAYRNKYKNDATPLSAKHIMR